MNEEKVIEFVSKKLANGKRIQELQILKRILTYAHGLSKIGLFAGLSEDMREYGKICMVHCSNGSFCPG